MQCTQIADSIWEIPSDAYPQMRVPVHIHATPRLFESMEAGVFEQICNVASLPEVVAPVCCMPDGHRGYGFPIGGVAAMDPESGVISPGGIGFDINCGMRLVRTSLSVDEVRPRRRELIDRLAAQVPAGKGASGNLKLSRNDFCELIEKGAGWCFEHGYATSADLERTEDGGCLAGADAGKVSAKAIERGIPQVGTLGAGNHYLEIQEIEERDIFDAESAKTLGVGTPGQCTIMIHCGSRGFGHQVASDYLDTFLKVMGPKYGLDVRDKQLACAPFRSPEGQDYFSAMACAVNMAFANRQMILHRVRRVFAEVFGKSADELGMTQVYDGIHNTAKLETHRVDGEDRQLLVHRKGATRAFPPGAEGLPSPLRQLGQPVIIGGSMETGSYLLAGVELGAQTFYSTAHGSGRIMSRNQAKRQFRGSELRSQMAERGIEVHAASLAGLAEEAGGAYKDVDEVIEATVRSGISRRIVRFRPVANLKG